MHIRQGLFIFTALSLLLFPSLLFASREEVMNETLRKLELNSTSEEKEKEGVSVSKVKTVEPIPPAFYGSQDYYAYASEKYQYAKEELDKEGLFKDKTDAGEGTGEAKRVFYISGGYDNNHIHYKELEDDETLDEDYGKLKGFYLEAGYRDARYVPWLMGRPFIEGYYRRYDALITYDGASSLGPLSFKERAEVHRYGIKAGAYREFLKKGEIFAYLDLGKRIWYRGENGVIEGVLTYAEKYWWEYLGIGLGINYPFLQKLTCGAELEAMGTLDAKMRADLYEGGTFRLGGVAGWELKLPIKYYLLKNVSLDLTPYFTSWNISKSDYVTISGSSYIEPDSHTHIEGLLVGITCRL